MDRKTLGRLGEDAAAEYLKKRGYRILARNWRGKIGEIDIVAQKSGAFMFVEVKALRREQGAGSKEQELRPVRQAQGLRPEDHMTPWKRAKVARLAEYYLALAHKTGAPWQIDLVAIDASQEGEIMAVRHIERI